jgi:uncharacterized protein (DUF433 family)
MSTASKVGIRLDEHGIAWIKGTNTKVIEVVLDHVASGWSSAEIHRQHPHLTLAQIEAALAYYRVHRADLDAEIERRYQEVERLRAAATGQFTRQELEARLKKPRQAKESA